MGWGQGETLLAGAAPKLSFAVENAGSGQSVHVNLKIK